MPDEGRLKLCYRSRPCSRASLKIALLGRPDLAGSTVPPCQAARTNPLPGLRCVAQKMPPQRSASLGFVTGPSMPGRRSVRQRRGGDQKSYQGQKCVEHGGRPWFDRPLVAHMKRNGRFPRSVHGIGIAAERRRRIARSGQIGASRSAQVTSAQAATPAPPATRSRRDRCR